LILFELCDVELMKKYLIAFIILTGLSGFGCDQLKSLFGGGDNSVSAKTSNELQINDMEVGKGTEATAGKTVSVHYTGWLTNGTKFDSSKDRGQPFNFKLGAGMVIKGWDQGVAGMKVGGKRKLTIPPTLGYGDRNVGPIPANSTLVFEVELLGVN
jgi:FKBP-type peptidyl-prolyl cis-trans isomerase FkpA